MTIIQQNCLNCNNFFKARSQDINRGFGKFCSRSCSTEHRVRNIKPKTPNVKCSYCNKEFYLNSSKKKNSKSGLFFCCREHKDIAQRIGGIEAIMPPHYGTSSGLWSYRKKALEILPNECFICGYNKHKSLLQIHHKDMNRKNNHPSNWEIFCPTHHLEWHYKQRGWI